MMVVNLNDGYVGFCSGLFGGLGRVLTIRCASHGIGDLRLPFRRYICIAYQQSSLGGGGGIVKRDWYFLEL